MREHTYVVQKGNEVRPEFVDRKVSWMKAETIGEALGLPTDIGEQISRLIAGAQKSVNPHFENEVALVAAGEQQRDIAARADIRSVLGAADGTLEIAAKTATELTIGAPRAPGAGVGKVLKPQTIANRTAQGVGNKLFDKCYADEAFLNRMIKNGAFERAEYDAWLAVAHPATPATPTA